MVEHAPAASAMNAALRKGRRFAVLFRARLRDRRFWAVQGLVGGITVAHGLLEATEAMGEHEALSFVPVSFYLIPVLYAGLHFGIEGALPTALWSGLLAIPNAFIWHDALQRTGELFQLVVLVVVAVVVARRVDGEAQAKERAERWGTRLAQLNATASAASQSLEPSRVVAEILDAILKAKQVDMAWIASSPGDLGLPPVSILSKPAAAPVSMPDTWEGATRTVLQHGQPWLDDASANGTGQARPRANAIVVPLRIAGELIGALGVGSNDSSLSVDDLSLLDAMAHQLAVALDNSRHHQEAKKALEELAGAQENLRSYLRLATEAQEEERKRLARELHDDTIQSLVVIKANLDTLASGQRPSGTARVRLDAVKQMVEATVDGVRRFTRDLRPSILDDLGLVHAIDWLTADIARRTRIQAHLDVQGESRRFSVDRELAVYRIVQEALRNVERHSGAAAVHVALTFSPEGLVAQVADDGSGFDLEQVLGRHDNDVPLGLIGMQERVKLAGGALEIETQPSQGTKVRVTLMSLS